MFCRRHPDGGRTGERPSRLSGYPHPKTLDRVACFGVCWCPGSRSHWRSGDTGTGSQSSGSCGYFPRSRSRLQRVLSTNGTGCSTIIRVYGDSRVCRDGSDNGVLGTGKAVHWPCLRCERAGYGKCDDWNGCRTTRHSVFCGPVSFRSCGGRLAPYPESVFPPRHVFSRAMGCCQHAPALAGFESPASAEKCGFGQVDSIF